MELMAAHNNWASRPADEKFWTLKDMYLQSVCDATNSAESTVHINRLGVEATSDGGLVLTTPHNGVLDFTSWSFSQLARTIGAPADYLKSLPSPLAKANLDEGFRRATKLYKNKPNFQMYLNKEDDEVLAITRKYGRCQNHTIIKKLMELDGGWRPPPARAVSDDDFDARPATAEDVACATAVREGEMIGPAGLYLSAEDMFVLLVDPETRINDGSDGGLSRGFFATNSEVGKKSFSITSFLFRYTCGNLIVWGAEDVQTFRRKHVGENATTDIFAGIDEALSRFQKSSAKNDEALITAAKKEMWSGLDELRDEIFGKQGWVGKRNVDAAYALAEQYAGTDGSPRSPYGFVNGLTRLSQRLPYADQRIALDQAGGKILRELVTL